LPGEVLGTPYFPLGARIRLLRMLSAIFQDPFRGSLLPPSQVEGDSLVSRGEGWIKGEGDP